MAVALDSITIKIHLPLDRDFLGMLSVLDGSGHISAGPFRIAARASDEIAAEHGNPTRATTLPYGDPPLGSYRFQGLASTGEGTRYRRDLYGTRAVILLAGTGGHAALADANGRFEIVIHGGPLAANGGLRASTGHFRISDPDLEVLSELIQRAKAVACICEEAPMAGGGAIISDLPAAPEPRTERRAKPYKKPRTRATQEYLVAFGEYADGGDPNAGGDASLNSPNQPPAGQQGQACMGLETICQNMQVSAALAQDSTVNPWTGSQSPVNPLIADPFNGGPSPFFPGGQPVNAFNGGQVKGGLASPTGSNRTGTGIRSAGGTGNGVGNGIYTGNGSPANGSAIEMNPYNASQQSGASGPVSVPASGAAIPFYLPPSKGDIFSLIPYHDTGSTFLNYAVNWYYGLSNLVGAVFNLPGEMLASAEDALRAIGFSEMDIQALQIYSLSGELTSLVSGARQASIATEEVFGEFLRTPNVLGGEEISQLPQATQWTNRVPGVQLAQSGDWWMKQVHPDANALMRWWGQTSINSQYDALGRLGGLATPYAYVDGVLYTQDVGEVMPGFSRLLDPLSRNIYIQGSLQIGTFFNDIQPRNMGASGLVFDPAIDPVTKTIFWGSVLGIGVGFGYAVEKEE